MKITKYGHACIILEEDGRKLIIDPGVYSNLPDDLTGVEAIVITHHHADHLSNDKLADIAKASPGAAIYANKQSADDIESSLELNTVDGKLEVALGPFEIAMEDHDHAVIYQASPCKNLSVQVGDAYYYPGDSYKPNTSHAKVVGVPMSGPWAKIEESIDYALSCVGSMFIPVHDAHLNGIGVDGYNNWLDKSLQGAEKTWQPFSEGDSIDV